MFAFFPYSNAPFCQSGIDRYAGERTAQTEQITRKDVSYGKTLQELADLLQGSIIQGDPSLKLTGVNGLEEAGPTEISFAVPPYLELAGKSRAGAIMIPEEGELKGPQALIRVKNPRAAFAKLLMLFRPPESVESGISQYAFVHPTARIGKMPPSCLLPILQKMLKLGIMPSSTRTFISAAMQKWAATVLLFECHSP